jgi:ParB family chromosome partitioning protein
MSKKRRVFDIDFDDAEASVPAGTPETRRGPMATAITENADALAARQSAEAAIRAENDALAHEHVRLKKAGLITDLIPLDQIKAEKLTRDRVAGRDDEIDELKASIRDIGLSNPIRVEKLEQGYELIQGYRRLTAFRELYDETGDAAYAAIPAGINASGEHIQQLYRRMVDENLVRRGVSFGEMAQLVIAYRNEDPTVESYDRAVEVLFASSGRQRRSYIKSFVRLIQKIGGSLEHLQAVPRAQGLNLLKRIEEDPGQCDLLRQMLDKQAGRSAEQEQMIIQGFLNLKPALRPKSEAQKTAKTTFRMIRPEGTAKCTAADGRIELQLDRDFSGLERKRLEAAVRAFFDTLDG